MIMNSPIEEIKSRIDIVELVGGYVKLSRGGSNFKALCPFHTEKTPSFNVSPTRQIWHCFGCGIGGDHFKFVMQIEGLDFPEALRMLAKRAGVELKREDPRIRSEKNRLYDLLEDAAVYFQKNLETVSSVKAYLKKRGILDKTASDFRVGFSFDSWDGLIKYLVKKGYKESEVEKAGLAVLSENGSRYDRFRSRIMFPITDGNGRVVGFGGRIFEMLGAAKSAGAEDAAKYINTPQTLVYDKSRVLYAFDLAKESIRKKNACVIVEGYMDAVMSHQAGVVNAVAVSGTALTIQQLKTIRRLADTLISSFDRDSAGEAATKRSLDLAAEFDFERKAALLPKGIKDPADLVLIDPAAWINAVDNALPVVEFYLNESLAKHSAESAAGVKAIAKEVLPEIATLSNEMEKAHWVVKLAKALAISEEAVWQELGRLGKTEKEAIVAAVEAPAIFLAKSRKEELEELSLGAISIFSNLVTDFSDRIEFLFSRAIHRDIFKSILAGSKIPLELAEYANHLIFRVEAFLEPTENKEHAARSLLKELQAECLKEKRDAITRKIIDAEQIGDDTLVAELAGEYKLVCNELHNATIDKV